MTEMVNDIVGEWAIIKTTQPETPQTCCKLCVFGSVLDKKVRELYMGCAVVALWGNGSTADAPFYTIISKYD